MRVQSMFGLRLAARVVIGVVLAAGASAACSSSTSAPSGGNTTADGGATPPGTPGTPGTSGKSACQLLVRADSEAAVGQPLPEHSENATLGMCQYTTADFAAGASITVSSWDSIKMAATSGKGQPTPITGVGDEALNLNGSNGSLLYVRKGSQGFLLVLNGPMIDHLPDHGLEKEKVLAAQILANF